MIQTLYLSNATSSPNQKQLTQRQKFQRLRHSLWRWRYSTWISRTRHFYKRLIHLIYRYRHEDRLRQAIFKNSSQPIARPSEVTQLFGTLPRVLNKLRLEMHNSEKIHEAFWLRNVRPFRGRFCHIVREFRGYSSKELCILLNSHPDISRLDEKYPCFHLYYPFTPKFLTTFECDISKILEYCSQGFLFGIGFPTEELAHLITRICGAEKEFVDFKDWCAEFQMRESKRI